MLLEFHFSGEPPTAAGRLHGHAMTTLSTAVAFFYISRMKGIYEVPSNRVGTEYLPETLVQVLLSWPSGSVRGLEG